MKGLVGLGRLNYQPTFGYKSGVLIGDNWYEETVHYIHEKHDHKSLVSQDFIDKGICFVDPNIYWNNLIPGKGFDPRLVMDHEGTKYHDNHSTTYDLSYSKFPKWKPNKIREYNTMRKLYLPEEDFAKNYGNITNFGLKEKKRNQWAYDVASANCTWNTEINEQFKPPKPSDYCVSRIATSRSLSGKHFPINVNYHHMRMRNKQLLVMPDFPIKLQERKYPHFYY